LLATLTVCTGRGDHAGVQQKGGALGLRCGSSGEWREWCEVKGETRVAFIASGEAARGGGRGDHGVAW
jgi:hypothetical protein